MKKFRKITNKPLKNLNDLDLNVVRKNEIGSVVRNTEVDKYLKQLFDYVNKNSDRTMIGVENNGKVYLSNQVKSSASRKKLYTFPEPNPICLYFNIANENLEKSAILKNKILSKKQNFDAIEDFELFSKYFSLTTQGIVFLVTTVEGFINQFFEDKEYIIDEETMERKDLEWAKLKVKLDLIIPTLLNIKFSELHYKEYQRILNTNILRNDLIHLKRTEKGNNTWYQELFKQLLDYNHHKNSEAVFKLLNTLKPDYFETQK